MLVIAVEFYFLNFGGGGWLARGEMVDKGLQKAVLAGNLNKDLFAHYKHGVQTLIPTLDL